MCDLVLSALSEVVTRYPEIIPMLKGDARWRAEVQAMKLGEAPDNAERLYHEMVLEGKLSTYLVDQLGRVVKELRKGGLPPTFWERELIILWDELSDTTIGILVQASQGAYALMPDVVQHLTDELDVRMSLVSYAREYRDTWLSYINETTRAHVADAITAWHESGEPIDNLIKILSNPDLGLFDKKRAKLIATTEVTRLYAYGNYAMWKEKGYIKSWRWNTANDERVCEICGPREGQIYPLEYLAPGSTSDVQIPAHPRCRCWATPIVDVDAIEFDFTLEPGEYLV